MDEDLSFHISADALAVIRAMRQTQTSVDQLAVQTAKRFGDMQRAGQSLANLFGGLFAGLSVGAVVGKLVGVQREFDVLNSSLITITGSSAAAEQEMRWIKEFAATTPFALTEVTQAFVKMKSLGLDASQQALESYGNTASAMGKNLNQLIEAVADAATGEFERLKEFGIKASSEGNKVSLTFRGVTTTIGKNADEITGYLQKLGDNEFAGAMAVRAATLDGAISNLGDTWDELFRTVNQGNAGGLIADSVRLANSVLTDAITLLQALNGVTAESVSKAGEMGAAQQGLGLVLETVTLIVVELSKYVRVAGNEIGAFAAQVVALATLNFAGAAEIGRTSAAETDRILAASDRLSDSVALARQRAAELKAAANAGAGEDAQSRRAAAQAKTAADAERAARAAAAKAAADAAEAAKKANKELEEQRKLIAELNGLQPDYIEQLTRIGVLRAKATLNETEYVAAVEALIAKQPGSIALAKQQAELDKERVETLNALAELERKRTETAEQTTTSLTEQNQALRDEIELIGLTERAQLGVLQARNEVIILTKEATLAELERASTVTGTQTRIEIALAEEIRLLRERAGLLNQKLNRTEAAEVYSNLQAEGQRFMQQLEQGLTDSLFRAFEAGRGFFSTLWDGIKNLFKTTVLKLVIQGVVGGVSGLAASAASAATGGASDAVFGQLQTGQSLYSLATSASSLITIGSELAAGTLSLANAAGTIFANATGTGISGLLATNAAYGTAAGAAAGGAGAAAGAGASGAAAGLSATGWGVVVVAVLAALGAFRSKKIVDYGLAGELGGQVNDYTLTRRGGSLVSGPSYSVQDRGIAGNNQQLQDAYNAIRLNVAGMAEQLGLGSDAIKTFTVRLGNDLIHPDTGGYGIKLEGLTQDQILAKIEEALLSANEQLAAFALGTTEFTRDGETAVQTLGRLTGSLGSVNSVFKTLGLTLADASLAGADAASKFLDSFGGADQFAQVASSYYQNFYTEAERTANTVEALRQRFFELGTAGATTREEFRALVEEQQRLHGATSPVVAELLKLESTFASVVPAIDAVTQAAAQQAEQAQQQAAAIASERSDRLRIERETAQAAKAAADELAKLNEQNFRLAITAGNVSAALAARGNTGPSFADFQGASGFNAAGYNLASIFSQQRGAQDVLAATRQQNPFEVSDFFGVIAELESTIASFQANIDSGEFTGGVSLRQQQAQQAFGDFLSPEQIKAAADGLTSFSNVLSIVTGTAAQGAIGADQALRVLEGAYTGTARQSVEYARGLEIIGNSVGVATGNLQDIQAAIQSGLDYFNSGEYYQAIAQEQLRVQVQFTSRAFTALTQRAASFNTEAEGLETSFDVLDGFIGRLKSVQDAFANAGGDRAAEAGLISDAARRIGEIITTPVAEAARNALADLPSFAGLDDGKLRDLSLLLKDLGQFDNAGLEKTFIRVSEALASGTVTGEQYAALIEYTESVYLGTATALNAVAEAGAAAADILREREGLELRILQLQGNTAELRRRELDALDPSNRAFQQFIYLLEDQARLEAEATRLADAFGSIRDSVRNLIDGLVIDSQRSILSPSQILGEAERQYRMNLAGAFEGDTQAAGQLGGSVNALLEAARNSATSEVDYNRTFGRTVGDLQGLESFAGQRATTDDVVAELRAVRAELAEVNKELDAQRAELRAGMAQIASNTGKTKDQLQGWTVNGLPATET